MLLADFLPAMLLGPLFGAAADRWSRRRLRDRQRRRPRGRVRRRRARRRRSRRRRARAARRRRRRARRSPRSSPRLPTPRRGEAPAGRHVALRGAHRGRPHDRPRAGRPGAAAGERRGGRCRRTASRSLVSAVVLATLPFGAAPGAQRPMPRPPACCARRARASARPRRMPGVRVADRRLQRPPAVRRDAQRDRAARGRGPRRGRHRLLGARRRRGHRHRARLTRRRRRGGHRGAQAPLPRRDRGHGARHRAVRASRRSSRSRCSASG